MQKAKYQCKKHNIYQCKLQIKTLESDLQSTVVRDWNSIKNFHKPPITFENFPRISEVFRTFPKIFKECWKIVLRTFRHFPKTSEDFRRFPKTSNNFRRFQKIFKNAGKLLSTLRQISEIFRRFPMTSKDFTKKFKMLEGRLEHFATFSDFFQGFPKRLPEISEDFRGSLKISKDFQKLQKLVGMFVFVHSGAFS